MMFPTAKPPRLAFRASRLRAHNEHRSENEIQPQMVFPHATYICVTQVQPIAVNSRAAKCVRFSGELNRT